MLIERNNIKQNYKIRSGIYIGIVWCLSLIFGITYFILTDNETNILQFGPNNQIYFITFPINNWTRWSFVMIYSFLSQLIYTILSSTLSPYIKNVIQDHKTPQNEKGDYWNSQLIVQIYTLYGWLSHIFDIFLYLTLQIQYLIPSFIADITMTFYFTHFYIKNV